MVQEEQHHTNEELTLDEVLRSLFTYLLNVARRVHGIGAKGELTAADKVLADQLFQIDQRLMSDIEDAKRAHRERVARWQLEFAAASVVHEVAEHISEARKQANEVGWEKAREWLRDRILDEVVFVQWVSGPLFAEIVERIDPVAVENAMIVKREDKKSPIDDEVIRALLGPVATAQRILGQLLGIKARALRDREDVLECDLGTTGKKKKKKRTKVGKKTREKPVPKTYKASPIFDLDNRIADDNDSNLARAYVTKHLLKKH